MGKSSLPVDGLLQFTRGTRQLLGLLPIGSGRCGFFWGLPASELESFRKRGFAAFREDVLAISPMAEKSSMTSATSIGSLTLGINIPYPVGVALIAWYLLAMPPIP
jgi:hypothetical protein